VNPERCVVAEELTAEFPGLALHWIAVEAGSDRTPPAVRERLREMSNRISGPKAIQMRQEAVPWAYRVFFRQVGIDPDENRTPTEAIALERMRAGGFPSKNILDDALVIATVETNVPVMAFDEDRLSGPLGLRLAGEHELLGGGGRPLSSRQVVVADADRAVAVLFLDTAEGRGVHPGTGRMRLASVQVKGVPDVSVEESLWIARETLLEEV
jgi:DNA/RNA-binding domain of Phe-tRNA-synthetase-like protein